ncbi:MAG: YggS family pyridoxal phosphate-dependent enzyme [Candidatus Mycalebacterium zealandia]|nr:MAG: YggS family pyridoxal phosphate-dependent enzyme [Candidatus Mycalebacterium zealandia]
MIEIEKRVAEVRRRIDSAAERVNANGSQILLVAVGKTVAPEIVARAASSGLCHLGENYAQELRDKLAFFERTGAHADWHFVGRLQKNKVKYVVGNCRLIHSVDSAALASEIDKRAENSGVEAQILIEINQDSPSKGGVSPDNARDLFEFTDGLENVRARGLMTMPPYSSDPEVSRRYFRELRELRDEIAPDFPDASELSMGMSADFETAVEEGATIVRVGSLIFGERN